MRDALNIDAIKAGIVLSGLIGRTVKVTRAGQGKYLARCPFHADKTPSLAIDDNKGLWRCHGCGAGGDSITFVMKANRLTFIEAAQLLAGYAGMTVEHAAPEKSQDDDRHRVEAAGRIWREARDAAGTPVDAYLRRRGIAGELPATLRYHPALYHAPSGLALPAMVAAITRWPGKELTGIHRTYIDDTGRKASVASAKMMLGACRGGAVRLAPGGTEMAIAEGIETALSVQFATGLPTWAALSAGNLAALILPDKARALVIAADHDLSGTGQREGRKAADKWTRDGRTVRIILPDAAGTDFNDTLTGADHA